MTPSTYATYAPDKAEVISETHRVGGIGGWWRE